MKRFLMLVALVACAVGGTRVSAQVPDRPTYSVNPQRGHTYYGRPAYYYGGNNFYIGARNYGSFFNTRTVNDLYRRRPTYNINH